MKNKKKRILALILAAAMLPVSGISGSATEIQAPQYDTGDINGDGDVNAKDLTRLMRKIAGDEVVVFGSDLDGNGKTNAIDLTRLMKLVAGFEIETSIIPETVPETIPDTVPETEMETIQETVSETIQETNIVTEQETESETVPETIPETAPETYYTPATEPVLGEDALIFAENGVSEYVIVKPEIPSASEEQAADDIQTYFAKISGVYIPIVSDSAKPQEKEILIGRTSREHEGFIDRGDLGSDGFVIRTDGKKLYLAGGDQYGTLYAAYELLEAYLGCRFYTASVEKVPERSVLGINPIECDRQPAVFECRDDCWYDYSTDKTFCLKRKMYPTAARVGVFYTSIVKPEVYFESHPEYYSMDSSGVRNTYQICLTNPEVLELAIERVRSILTTRPGISVVYVYQEDNNGYCRCENCRRVIEEEGSPSGPVVRFINAIADALGDEFPDKLFSTSAYLFSIKPPEVTKPADNVDIRFCPIEACYKHSLGEDCSTVTETNYEYYNKWCEISQHITVFSYTENWVSLATPYYNFDGLLGMMRVFADGGTHTIHNEGNSFSKNCEFSELRGYMVSRVTWNPYMSEDEYYGYMYEFLHDVYGEGYTYLIDFLKLVDEETEQSCHKVNNRFIDVMFGMNSSSNMSRELPETLTLDKIINYETTDWSEYMNWYFGVRCTPVISEGQALFDKAIGLATEEQATRLRAVATQVPVLKSFWLERCLAAEGADIQFLLGRFFDSCETDMSYEEIDELIAVVTQYVTQYAKDSYLVYNQSVFALLCENGITRISLGSLRSDLQGLNLDKTPVDWK